MTTRHSACRRADAQQGRGNGGGRHRRRLGETRGHGRGAVEVARAQATTESSDGPTSWVRLLTAVEERPPLQGGHGEERNDCRIMVEVKKYKKGGAASRWRASPSYLVLAGPASTTAKSSHAPAAAQVVCYAGPWFIQTLCSKAARSYESSAKRDLGLHTAPQGWRP